MNQIIIFYTPEFFVGYFNEPLNFNDSVEVIAQKLKKIEILMPSSGEHKDLYINSFKSFFQCKIHSKICKGFGQI
jgi:hypothetical protein